MLLLTRPNLCLFLTNEAGVQILEGARMCDESGSLTSETDAENRFLLLRRGWLLQEMLILRRFLLCNYGENIEKVTNL